MNKTLARVIQHLTTKWVNAATGASVATSPILLWLDEDHAGPLLARLPLNASSISAQGFPLTVGDVVAARLAAAASPADAPIVVAYDWARPGVGIPPADVKPSAWSLRRTESALSSGGLDGDLDYELPPEPGVMATPSPPSSQGAPTPPVVRAYTSHPAAAPAPAPARRSRPTPTKVPAAVANVPTSIAAPAPAPRPAPAAAETKEEELEEDAGVVAAVSDEDPPADAADAATSSVDALIDVSAHPPAAAAPPPAPPSAACRPAARDPSVGEATEIGLDCL